MTFQRFLLLLDLMMDAALLKRRSISARLHGAVSQKTIIFIFAAVTNLKQRTVRLRGFALLADSNFITLTDRLDTHTHLILYVVDIKLFKTIPTVTKR
jgi:hypothetical protein